MTSTSLAFVPGVVKSNVEAEPAETARLDNIEKMMENLSKGFSELKKGQSNQWPALHVNGFPVPEGAAPGHAADLHSSLKEQELDSKQLSPLEDRISEIEVTAKRGKQRQTRSKQISMSRHLSKIRQDRDLGTQLLLVEEEERFSMAQVRLK